MSRVPDPQPGEALVYHPLLGHRVRPGDWYERGVSTYRRAEQALAAGRHDEAAELGRYTIEEAREAHELYRDWIDLLRRILVREGVEEPVVDDEEARIRANLRLPDGDEFDPDRGWAAYCLAVERFERACHRGEVDEARQWLVQARRTWQDTHDRKCDWVYGLLDVAARHLGEERIGDVWDELMAPMYRFYDRYDVDRTPWEESFETITAILVEAMRGHLCGPDRMGDLEVFEEDDRWGFRFDPCGSGGRTYRPEPSTGSPPRMEPPFNYAVTTAPHDWAWNKEGICLYCAHCCELMERVPIRKYGYPIRVVDPPTWPSARQEGKCTWYVYKNPALVPEEVYARVGERKPERLGSAARREEA